MTQALVPAPKARALEVRWITRDSGEDGLFDCVSVWCARPTRFTDELGAFWLARKDDDRILVVGVEQAAVRYRTIPDDDRQCVRLYAWGGV